jgi:hypothetical protein
MMAGSGIFIILFICMLRLISIVLNLQGHPDGKETLWMMVGPGIFIILYLCAASDLDRFKPARFDFGDWADIIGDWKDITISFAPHFDSIPWLSQASALFIRLGILSNFEDYGRSFTTSWSLAHVNVLKQLY